MMMLQLKIACEMLLQTCLFDIKLGMVWQGQSVHRWHAVVRDYDVQQELIGPCQASSPLASLSVKQAPKHTYPR